MTSSDSSCAAGGVAAAPGPGSADDDADTGAASPTSPADATPVAKSAAAPAAGSCPAEEQQALVQENSALLRSLSNYMLRDKAPASEEAATALLTAILPLGPQVRALLLQA